MKLTYDKFQFGASCATVGSLLLVLIWEVLKWLR